MISPIGPQGSPQALTVIDKPAAGAREADAAQSPSPSVRRRQQGGRTHHPRQGDGGGGLKMKTFTRVNFVPLWTTKQ